MLLVATLLNNTALSICSQVGGAGKELQNGVTGYSSTLDRITPDLGGKS